MQAAKQEQMWRETLLGWPMRSRALFVVLMAVLVLFVTWVTVWSGRQPLQQSGVCATGYRAARTASETVSVDMTIIGSGRAPGMETCGQQRILIEHPRAGDRPNDR